MPDADDLIWGGLQIVERHLRVQFGQPLHGDSCKCGQSIDLAGRYLPHVVLPSPAAEGRLHAEGVEYPGHILRARPGFRAVADPLTRKLLERNQLQALWRRKLEWRIIHREDRADRPVLRSLRPAGPRPRLKRQPHRDEPQRRLVLLEQHDVLN